MQKHWIIWTSTLLLCLCITMTCSAKSTILVMEGSHGEDVQHVQKLLFEQGYLTKKADGHCERQTVRAIQRFQHDAGLEIDGICGHETYTALKAGSNKHGASEGARGRPLKVHASAYTSKDRGVSSRTSTGEPLKRGIIAVDPNFIPLGTRVYIPGYGEATASDIGSAIKDNQIDLAFNSRKEALAFGRRDLTIYILK